MPPTVRSSNRPTTPRAGAANTTTSAVRGAASPLVDHVADLVQTLELNLAINKFHVEPGDRVLVRIPNNSSKELTQLVVAAFNKLLGQNTFIVTTFDMEVVVVRDAVCGVRYDMAMMNGVPHA